MHPSSWPSLREGLPVKGRRGVAFFAAQSCRSVLFLQRGETCFAEVFVGSLPAQAFDFRLRNQIRTPIVPVAAGKMFFHAARESPTLLRHVTFI